MKRTIWTHISMLCATLLYGTSYRIAKSIMPKPIAPLVFIILRYYRRKTDSSDL